MEDSNGADWEGESRRGGGSGGGVELGTGLRGCMRREWGRVSGITRVGYIGVNVAAEFTDCAPSPPARFAPHREVDGMPLSPPLQRLRPPRWHEAREK